MGGTINIMERTRNEHVQLLLTLFVTSIVISNVIAGKIVKVGFLSFPASVISYVFTFILVNLSFEIAGKEGAKRFVKLGFLAQIVASLLILMGLFLPADPLALDKAQAYKTILGLNWRITLASFGAYFTAQAVNLIVFSLKLAKNKSVLNFLSISIAQFFDTIVFTLIAFLGVYSNLLWLMISQYIVKIIVVFLLNPIFTIVNNKISKG